MRIMRVAILHDYLNQYGGAERVLEALFEIFPEAHLYTLLYDEHKTKARFAGKPIQTSFLDIPFIKKRHRAFIPFMPLGAKFLTSKKPYDLVISSSAGYAKGFAVDGTYHISYCLSPLRYAWEIDYMKDLPYAPWPLKEWVVRPVAAWLKSWDKNAASKVNMFIADSNYIAEKVRSYYGRDAAVIYPPVDGAKFYPEPHARYGEYYLMAGRLLYYKVFDVGIKAFNRLKKPLKIVGCGPEFKKLKKLATSPYITFITDANDDDLRMLYNNARAFIFPQIEDFGLVAAEAQTCGLPVIAYNVGGGGEIVEHKKTGVLFDRQTPEALIDAIKLFETFTFNRTVIQKSASRFSKENFKTQFSTIVSDFGFRVETS